MRLPESIRDNSIVRVAIQVDGSFNDTLELTGAELKRLAGLISNPQPVAQVLPKLVAGDAAAEKRENTPLVRIETRSPETVTSSPETVSGEDKAPKVTLDQAPESTPIPPTAESAGGPTLPSETPDLGE